jgi:exodeoxyribonuclease VII small subunit
MANNQKIDDPQAAAVPRQFEDELADLEAVVRQIDTGELTLEESILAFEHGVALVRSLNHKLDEVERRVEILTRGAGGELRGAPYRGEGLPPERGGKENGGAAKKDEDDDVQF